jgi:hypothetical protein
MSVYGKKSFLLKIGFLNLMSLNEVLTLKFRDFY